MIVYQDIIVRLAAAGYTSYRIRNERIIPSSTMTRIRNNEPITTETIDTICRLCECQPGDFLRWIPDEDRD